MGEAAGPPPPPPPPATHGKREPSLDPVKAQGILTSLTKKERNTAKEWEKTWTFYTRAREMLEEEALARGLSLEEYRSALKKLSCEPAPAVYPVEVDPSPKPIPSTSSAMVGRRATCPLERYGRRLVKSQRDYPLRPPLPPGQVYDPYKQTYIFLGIDCGDPISYCLPARRGEVPEETWSMSVQPTIAPLSQETLDRALRLYYR